MQFDFESLNDDIRTLMMAEFEKDLMDHNAYFCKRFNQQGDAHFLDLMREAILCGNEQTLATKLNSHGAIKQKETAIRANTLRVRRTPRL